MARTGRKRAAAERPTLRWCAAVERSLLFSRWAAAVDDDELGYSLEEADHGRASGAVCGGCCTDVLDNRSMRHVIK